MCLLSFLKWGSIGYSLGIVQWDFTRRYHPGNPGRVSGSDPVTSLNLASPHSLNKVALTIVSEAAR